MSGVSGFFRRLSHREPKKNTSKSASTSHLPQKSQLVNNFDAAESESNIPYCLRQPQRTQNNANNNRHNNINNNNDKELSRSCDLVGLREAKYINNLRKDETHSYSASQYQVSFNSGQDKRQAGSASSSRQTGRARQHSASNQGCLKHPDGPRRDGGGVNNINRASCRSLQNFSAKEKNEESRVNKVVSNSRPNDRRVSNEDQTSTVHDIIIHKDRPGQGLGFTIAGGRDAPGDGEAERSVHVQRVVSGGLAFTDGRIRPLDIIISINGVEVQRSTQTHAVSLLKNSGTRVHLRVRRSANMEGRIIEASLKKDTNSKGLGFSISGGMGTPERISDEGIFVTQIFPGGVAERDGRMRTGDKILCVNDSDLTRKTHGEAVNVLRSATLAACSVTLQLLRSQPFNDTFNKTRNDTYVASTHNTINNTYNNTLRNNTTYGDNNNNSSEPIYSKVIKNDIGTLNFSDSRTLHKPRKIVIRRSNPGQGLGVNIVGGVKGRGLYVNYVIPGSLSERQTDLMRGDRLLRVNHMSLEGVNHQEAIGILKNSGEHVVIFAQHQPRELDDFEKWMSRLRKKKDEEDEYEDDEEEEDDDEDDRGKTTAGNLLLSKDDIFLRSLFDYDPFLDVTFSPLDPPPIERLKVRFGDVFRISRKDLAGDWLRATKVFSNEIFSNKNKKSIQEAGVIPGKNSTLAARLEKTTPPQGSNRNSTEMRTSKKRRSFILSSKLKPSIKGGAGIKSNSCYEHVVMRQCIYTRPVMIFGPLKERMTDLLTSNLPQLFEVCVPHTTRPMRRGEVSGREYVFVMTKQEMQRDVDLGKFAEVGIYKDHYYGISYESVKFIANQHKHCLLDVSVDTIARLNASDIFPIVIILKSSSKNLIGSWLNTEDERRLKKVNDDTTDLLNRYRNFFTAVVEGSTEEDLYRGVRRTVDMHGRKFLWVTSDEKI